jgi:hypothetical protein
MLFPHIKVDSNEKFSYYRQGAAGHSAARMTSICQDYLFPLALKG